MARARRCALRSMSRHTRVAIAYSHDSSGPRGLVEAVEAAPRPDQRLLHGVLRLEPGREEPVAVRGQLGPMPLQQRTDVAFGH